ncbi:hypothetical protein DSCO28_34500 [Desulfosarcina ovata subsp. sediminis]|uniref:Uncharacterized protein n=1 Tax=Desulfosarcina ovata subsp. sediminis TaxID=885957 RepID=A0A5K7ZMS5_9BACT|nr:hypothetical protein DSCO28_34500 [Desulfosarcina ovata subsp. sediminis]
MPGNIYVRGDNSDLLIQSNLRWVSYDGFSEVSDQVRIVGLGAREDGVSVDMTGLGEIVTTGIGGGIVIEGAEDVEIATTLVAGGVIEDAGVTFTAPDSFIDISAAGQLLVEGGLLAPGSITLTSGVADGDDEGAGLVLSSSSGLTVSGWTSDGTGGLITINAGADHSFMGRIVSGANISQTRDADGNLIDETFVWSDEASSVVINVAGQAYIGGMVDDGEGGYAEIGTTILASSAITINGETGGAASEDGVSVNLVGSSILATHDSDSSIEINAVQGATINGRIIVGGDVAIVRDSDGDTLGTSVTTTGSAGVLTIDAGAPITLSNDIFAGSTIDLTGSSSAGSQYAVTLGGTARLVTAADSGQVLLDGAGDILIQVAADAYELSADGWPVDASGVLSSDVSLELTIDHLDFVATATVTISATDTVDNTDVLDLVDDVNAALLAADFVITEDYSTSYDLGDSWSLDGVSPEITAQLDSGRFVLVGPYALSLSSTSSNADLLGFSQLDSGDAESSAPWTIDAGGDIILGDSSNAYSIDQQGSIRAGGDIIFNGTRTGSGTVGSSGTIDLYLGSDATFSTDLVAESIVLRGAGDMTIAGGLSAESSIQLISSGTLTTVNSSDIAITGDDGSISLQAEGDITINSHIGDDADGLKLLDVESTSGVIHLDHTSGHLESAGAITLSGDLDLQGVITTTDTTAASDDYELDIDTADIVTLTATFNLAGAARIQSSGNLDLSDLTLITSDALSLIASGDLTIGAISDDAGNPEQRSAILQGGSLVDIQAGGLVTINSGSKVLSSGADSLIQISADGLSLIGTLQAGATPDWSGTGADIILDISDQVVLGGSAIDTDGSTVTRGGSLLASGSIDIDISGGSSVTAFSMNSLSQVYSDATGEGSLSGSEASSISISSDRAMQLRGSLSAEDAGSTLGLTTDDDILVDANLYAGTSLDLTAATLTQNATSVLATGVGGSIALTTSTTMTLGGYVGHVYDSDSDGTVDSLDTDSVSISGGDVIINLQVEANDSLSISGDNVTITSDTLVKTRNASAELTIAADDTLINYGSIGASGLIHLIGNTVIVDGIISQIGTDGRVLVSGVNAVESAEIQVNGTVESAGTIDLHSGLASSWTLAQLTGSVTSADLSGGDILILDSTQIAAVGDINILAGGDVEVTALPGMKDGLTAVEVPRIASETTSIDLVTGYNETLSGTIETPVVEWVSTSETVEVSRVEVTIGYLYYTLDITLSQDGYWTTDTSGDRLAFREYFIEGIDYNNSDAIDWADFDTSTPDADATFAELTSAQKDAVLAYLNYAPVYDLLDGVYEFDADGVLTTVDVATLTAGWTDTNNYDLASIDWTTYGVDAPTAGTAFAGLTEAQQQTVLDSLGYLVYNLNPTLHRVVNGIPSEEEWSDWSDDWNTSVVADEYTVVQLADVDALNDIYIRIPTLVSDEFVVAAEVISQGTAVVTTETVGQYQDQADVYYEQDRSVWQEDPDVNGTNRNVDAGAISDADGSPGRWAVYLSKDGDDATRIYDLTDETTTTDLTMIRVPDWALNATTAAVVGDTGIGDTGVEFNEYEGWYDSSRDFSQQLETTTVTLEEGGTVDVNRLVFAHDGFTDETLELVETRLLQTVVIANGNNDGIFEGLAGGAVGQLSEWIPTSTTDPLPITYWKYDDISHYYYYVTTVTELYGFSHVRTDDDMYLAWTDDPGIYVYSINSFPSQLDVNQLYELTVPEQWSTTISTDPAFQGLYFTDPAAPGGTDFTVEDLQYGLNIAFDEWIYNSVGSAELPFYMQVTFGDEYYGYTYQDNLVIRKQGPGSPLGTDGDGNYVYEQFYNYYYRWYSNWHDITDTRETYQYAWTSGTTDITAEVAVTETRDILTQVTSSLTYNDWATSAVVEAQSDTVDSRTTDTVNVPAAGFSAETLLSGGALTIEAGNDVIISALLGDGSSTSITISAGNNLTLSGSLPDGASADTLPAPAELRASTNISLSAGGLLNGDSSSLLVADCVSMGADSISYDGSIEAISTIDLSAVGSVTTSIDTELTVTAADSDISLSGSSLTLTNSLFVSPGTLSLTATGGAVDLSNGAYLDVGTLSVAATENLTLRVDDNEADHVDLQVTGTAIIDLTLTDSATQLDRLVTAGGNVTITAQEALTYDQIDAGAGTVTLDVWDTVSAVSGADISAGVLDVTARGNTTLATSVSSLSANLVASGDLNVTDSNSTTLTLTSITVRDGAVTVDSAGDLVLETLDLGLVGDANDVTLSAARNMTIGLLSAGSYSDDPANPAQGISFADVTLSAVGSITGDSGQPVNIMAETLSLTAGTGGSLVTAVDEYLLLETDSGTLSMTDLDSERVDFSDNDADDTGLILTSAVSSDGSISVTSSGTLTISGATVADDLTLSAADMVLDGDLTAGGDLILTSAGQFQVGVLTAAELAALTDEEIQQLVGGSDLSLNGDLVRIDTVDAISMAGSITASSALEIYSDANIYLQGTINGSLDSIILEASGEQALDGEYVDPTTGLTETRPSGQVMVDVTGTITAADWDVSALSGIEIRTTSDLAVTGSFTGLTDGTSPESLILASDGDLTLGAGVYQSSDSAELRSGGTIDMSPFSELTTTDLAITSVTGVTAYVEATGLSVVNSGSGDVLIEDASTSAITVTQAQNTDGSLTIKGDADMTVIEAIISTDAVGNDLTLQAGGLSLTDGSPVLADLLVGYAEVGTTNGIIELVATNMIGEAQVYDADVDVVASQINFYSVNSQMTGDAELEQDADTTFEGEVSLGITDLSDLTDNGSGEYEIDLKYLFGNVSLDAGTNNVVITALPTLDGQTVNITTTGDISFGSGMDLLDVGSGSLTLDAGSGDISFAGGSVSIIGTSLDLSAAAVNGGTLQTALDSLALNLTGSSGLSIEEYDDIELLNISSDGSFSLLADGDINLSGSFSGSGGVSLATTLGGTIGISGSLDGGSGAISLTSDDLELTGSISGSGNLELLPVDLSINIGLGGGAGAYNVDATELGNIQTTGTLTIGSMSGDGVITVGNGTDDVSVSQDLILNADAGGRVVQDSALVGDFSITANVLSGNTYYLNDDVTISGSFDVSGGLVVNGTRSISADGGISVSKVGENAVYGAYDATPDSLTLTTAGDITIQGRVGVSTEVTKSLLVDLTLNAGGAISLDNTMEISGDLSILSATSFTGLTTADIGGSLYFASIDTLSISSNLAVAGDLDVSNIGTLTLSGATNTITGDATFVEVDSGTISGTFTVNGSNGLSIENGSGILAFNDDVSADSITLTTQAGVVFGDGSDDTLTAATVTATSLDSLTQSGTATLDSLIIDSVAASSWGVVTISGVLDINSDTTATVTGSHSFSGALSTASIDLDGQSIVSFAGSVTTTSAGMSAANLDVLSVGGNLTTATSLDLSSVGILNLSGASNSIGTSATLDGVDSGTISGSFSSAGSLTIQNGTGTLTMNGDVSAASVILTDQSGVVLGNEAGDILTTDTLTASGLTSMTTGTLNVTDAVTLTDIDSLTASGTTTAGSLILDQVVNSSFAAISLSGALVITDTTIDNSAAGSHNFSGAVSVATISLSDQTSVSFDSSVTTTSGALTADTLGSLSVAGNLDVATDLSLTDISSLTLSGTDNRIGGNATFAGVDSASISGSFSVTGDLTIQNGSGTVAFADDVSAASITLSDEVGVSFGDDAGDTLTSGALNATNVTSLSHSGTTNLSSLILDSVTSSSWDTLTLSGALAINSATNAAITSSHSFSGVLSVGSISLDDQDSVSFASSVISSADITADSINTLTLGSVVDVATDLILTLIDTLTLSGFTNTIDGELSLTDVTGLLVSGSTTIGGSALFDNVDSGTINGSFTVNGENGLTVQDGSGTLAFNGDVSAADVTLASQDGVSFGAAAADILTTSTLTAAGLTTLTTGTLSLSEDLDLTAITTLTSAGGSIGGDMRLDQVLNSTLGATAITGTLTIADTTGSAPGSHNFTGALSAAQISLNDQTSVSFDSSLTTASGAVTVDSLGSLNVSGNLGTVTGLSLTDIASLTLSGTGNIIGGSAIFDGVDSATISGGFSVGAGETLTVQNGTGVFAFNGDVAAATIILTDQGGVVLGDDAADTLTTGSLAPLRLGSLSIGGSLVLDNALTLTDIGVLTLSGTTNSISGAVLLDGVDSGTISGSFSTAGSLTVRNGAGTLAFNGDVSAASVTLTDQGSVSLGNDAADTLTAGDLTASALTSLATGLMNISGGIAVSDVDDLTVTGTTQADSLTIDSVALSHFAGAVTITNAMVINADGSDPAVAGDHTFDAAVSAAGITLRDQDNILLSGDVTTTGGALAATSLTSLSIGGNLTTFGDFTLSDVGSFSLTGTISVGGDMTITGLTSLMLTSDLIFGGDLTLSHIDLFSVTGNTELGGSLTLTDVDVATFSGDVSLGLDADLTDTLLITGGSGLITFGGGLTAGAIGVANQGGLAIGAPGKQLQASYLVAGGLDSLTVSIDFELVAGLKLTGITTLNLSGVVDITGDTTFDSIGGATLASLSVGGDLEINSASDSTVVGSWDFSGNVSAASVILADQISATFAADLTSTSGAITISDLTTLAVTGNLDSATDLSLTDLTTATFSGDLTTAGNLSLTSIGTFSVAGATTVGGSMTLDSVADADLTGVTTVTGSLSANSDSDDTVAGDHSFHSAVSSGALTISTQNDVSFAADLSVTSLSADTLNSFTLAGTLTATGNVSLIDVATPVTLPGVVTVGGSLTIDNTNTTFAENVIVASTLNLRNSDSVGFNQDVTTGNLTARNIISVAVSGMTTIGDMAAGTGNLTLSSVDSTLFSGLFSAGGTVTALGGSALEFAGSVTAGTVNLLNLTSVSFGDAAGETVSVGNMTMTGMETLTFADSLDVSGDLQLNSISSALNVSGVVTVGGMMSLNSVKSATFATTVDVTESLTIKDGGGLVAITGDVTAEAVTLDGQDSISFDSDLTTTGGSFSADTLSSLSIAGNTNIASDLSLDGVGVSGFTGPVTVANRLNFSNGTEATFSSAVSAADLILNDSGSVVFGANLTMGDSMRATDIATLSVAGDLAVGTDFSLTGIGTLSVTGTTTIGGAMTLDSVADADFGAAVTVTDALTINSAAATVAGTHNFTGALSAAAISIADQDSVTFNSDLTTTGGSFSADTLSSLSIAGNTNIASDLSLDGVGVSGFTGSVTVANRLNFSNGTEATFSSAVSATDLILNDSGSVAFGANLTMGGSMRATDIATLNVAGDLAVGTDLSLTGIGTLRVTGTATIGGAMALDSVAEADFGAAVTVTDALTINSAAATVAGTHNFTGALSVAAISIADQDSVTFNSDLTTTGGSFSADTLSRLSIAGNTNIASDLSLDGVGVSGFTGSVTVANRLNFSNGTDGTFSSAVSAADLILNDSGGVAFGANLTMGDSMRATDIATLSVAGDLAVGTDLSLTGIGTLRVTGTTTIGGAMTLDSVAEADFGAAVTVTDALTINSAAATVAGTHNFTGALSAAAISIADQDSVTFNSDLTTTGGSFSADTLSCLSIAGNTNISTDLILNDSGSVVFGANLTMGDSMRATDIATLNVAGDLAVGTDLSLTGIGTLRVTGTTTIGGAMTLDSVADADFTGTTTVTGAMTIDSATDTSVSGTHGFSGAVSAASISIADQDSVAFNSDLTTTNGSFSADTLSSLSIAGNTDIATDLVLNDSGSVAFGANLTMGGSMRATDIATLNVAGDLAVGTDFSLTGIGTLRVTGTATIGGAMALDSVADADFTGTTTVTGAMTIDSATDTSVSGTHGFSGAVNAASISIADQDSVAFNSDLTTTNGSFSADTLSRLSIAGNTDIATDLILNDSGSVVFGANLTMGDSMRATDIATLNVAGDLAVGTDLSLTGIGTLRVTGTATIGGAMALDSVADADFTGTTTVTGAMTIDSATDTSVSGTHGFSGAVNAASISIADQDSVALNSDLTTTNGSFSANTLSSLSIAGNTNIASDLSLDGVGVSGFTGSVTVANRLNFSNGTEATFSSAVSAADLILNDSGSVVFGANLTMGDSMRATDIATLSVADDLAVGTDLSLTGIGTLRVTGTTTIGGAMTLDSVAEADFGAAVTVTDALTINSAAATVAGTHNFTGALSAAAISIADQDSVTFNSDLTTTGGSFIADTLSSLSIAGNTNIATDLRLDGVTDFIFSGDLTIGDTLSIANGIDVNLSTSVTFSSLVLQNLTGETRIVPGLFLNGVPISAFGGTVAAGDLLSSGTAPGTPFAVQMLSATDVVTLDIITDLTVDSDLNLTGIGTMTISGDTQVGSDAALDSVANADFGGSTAVAGTLTIDSNTDSSVSGSYAFGGNLSVAGDMSAASAISLDLEGSLGVAGSLAMSDVGELTVTGTVQVNGDVQMDAVGDLLFKETVTLGGSTEINGMGGSIDFEADVVAGSLALRDLDTVLFGGGLSSDGTFFASNVNTLSINGDFIVDEHVETIAVDNFWIFGSTEVGGNASITDSSDIQFVGDVDIAGLASFIGNGGTLDFQGSLDLNSLILEDFSYITGELDLDSGGPRRDLGILKIFPAGDVTSEDIEKINRILHSAFVLGGSSEQPWSSGFSVQERSLFDFQENFDSWTHRDIDDWLEGLLR